MHIGCRLQEWAQFCSTAHLLSCFGGSEAMTYFDVIKWITRMILRIRMSKTLPWDGPGCFSSHLLKLFVS